MSTNWYRHTNLFQEYDIRFYERPDKVHAKELHYSGGDIREFKTANRQAVRAIHTRRRTSVNGAEGELTGIENLLTPGLMKKAMALKMGCRDAVLDEQDRQDAWVCRAALEYSRLATQRALKIGTMHYASIAW